MSLSGRSWIPVAIALLPALLLATGATAETPPAADAPVVRVDPETFALTHFKTGPDKKLDAFDPKTERFVAVEDVSDVIRHMMYDAKTDAMWFGTDANRIGRVITRRAVR